MKTANSFWLFEIRKCVLPDELLIKWGFYEEREREREEKKDNSNLIVLHAKNKFAITSIWKKLYVGCFKFTFLALKIVLLDY